MHSSSEAAQKVLTPPASLLRICKAPDFSTVKGKCKPRQTREKNKHANTHTHTGYTDLLVLVSSAAVEASAVASRKGKEEAGLEAGRSEQKIIIKMNLFHSLLTQSSER